jgi:translocation and assembly module TamA
MSREMRVGRSLSRRTRIRAVSILILALLGCSLAGERRAAPELESLEIVGNERVPASDILEYLRTPRPGRWLWSSTVAFDADLLAEDVARVVELYKRRGFYSAAARSHVEWNTTRDHARVMIEVTEGRPVRVEERRIDFDPEPARTELWPKPSMYADALPGAPGEIFDVRAYQDAKDQLLRRLADSGYLRATIRGGAEVDVERRAARIAWNVDPGPLVLLGAVSIRGLEHIDPELMREEIGGARGQPLPLSWLEQTQRELADLGWFHSVTVRPMAAPTEVERARVETWPVLVEVDERPPRTIQAALGYSTEQQVRARLGWEHRQLLGGGRDLRLAAQTSGLGSRAEAAVVWPRFFVPSTTAELRFDLTSETLDAYDAQRTRLGFDVSRRIGLRTRARLGHRIELSRSSDVSDAADAILDDPSQRTFVSVTRLELERTTTDDRLNPSRGGIARVAADLASGALGSDVEYVRGEIEGRWYARWRSAVWATRLRAATFLPFGETEPEEIPITERLFLGGSDTVRGFDLQRLGPLDAEDEPVGGTTSLVGNLELRVPLRGNLSGVVFVDGGLVDLEPLRFRLADVRYASGVGLRFDTPVGPLRADVAVLLNAPDEEDRVRLHLSVGQAF